MINRALMAGLLSVGVDVQDLGVAPVSVVRYQIAALGLAGGVHVRKSPYDPQLLDIKFFDSRGIEVPPDREKAMERLFFMEDFERAPMEEHRDAVLSRTRARTGTGTGCSSSVDARGDPSGRPADGPRLRLRLRLVDLPVRARRARGRGHRAQRLPRREPRSPRPRRSSSARCTSSPTSSARSGRTSACSSTRGREGLPGRREGRDPARATSPWPWSRSS